MSHTSRTRVITEVLSLIVTIIACIAGVLTVPQVQRLIESSGAANPALPTFAPTAVITASPWQWPVVIFDRFNSNVNGWSVDDDCCRKSVVADGKYQVEMKPHNSFAWWTWINANSGTDFYLAVDVQLVSGPANSEYSIMFRGTENGHYLFQIRGDQFRVVFFKDQPVDLIGWTTSNAIKPGQANHLAVIGKGSHYEFLINTQFVDSLDDSRVSGGSTVGLEMFSTTDEQSAMFEYDNFELRAP